MADSDPGVPMRLVLDDWVVPADSVPVLIGRGEAIVRVRVDTRKAVAQITAQMKRLAETMAVIGDPDLVIELARRDALMPAMPANPEPGT